MGKQSVDITNGNAYLAYMSQYANKIEKVKFGGNYTITNSIYFVSFQLKI